MHAAMPPCSPMEKKYVDAAGFRYEPYRLTAQERGRMNIKDMEKVECEYCGGLFLVAMAVVLSDKGEFHYFCSKGCAMKARRPRSSKSRPTPELAVR